MKEFTGGMLVFAGANSGVSLRFLPARFLFLDEIDAYPQDVDGEGHPVELAENRTSSFARCKIFKNSTPLTKELSVIEPAYLHGSRGHYHVPCPFCLHMQWLQWKNFIFAVDGVTDPKLAAYRCENSACGKLIQEHHKPFMLENGQWVHEDPENKVRSFHINILYQPYGWKLSWEVLAGQWLKASKRASRGDTRALKVFINTYLAQTWEEKAEKFAEDELRERKELYPAQVPAGCYVLTGGVDVQDDRIECFDEQTEVLTRQGWKYFRDVSSLDELGTVNLKTDSLEYQRPLRLIERHHEGDMVKIKGQSTDILVTPNHRMIVFKGQAKTIKPQFSLAKDLKPCQSLKRRIGKWEGDPYPFVMLPASIEDHHSSNIMMRRGKYRVKYMREGKYTEKLFATLEEAHSYWDSVKSTVRVRDAGQIIDKGVFAEFMGWFVAEGHSYGKHGRYGVVLTQNAGPKADAIENVLRQLPWKYHRFLKPKRGAGIIKSLGRSIVSDKDCYTFTINSKQLYTFVSMNCGVGSWRKKAPGFVKDATPEVIERFLGAAISGDGWIMNRAASKKRPLRMYGTRSRQLADDVQELFIKCGKSSNVSQIKSGMYYVSELSSSRAYLTNRKIKPAGSLITTEQYSGQVYCASVPNETLVCRRNGKSFLAGNCEAKGWGLGEECWSIDYQRFMGSPAQKEVWDQLDAWLQTQFEHEHGIPMKMVLVCIDTGGHHTKETYQFVAKRQHKGLRAVKGSSIPGARLVSIGAKDKLTKVQLFMVGTDTAKDTLFANLKINDPGPSYYHFPDNPNYDDEYFAQLTAEEKREKIVKGVVVGHYYRKTRKRNEVLDLAVYNHAALSLLNPNMERLAASWDERVRKIIGTQDAKGSEQPAEQPTDSRHSLPPRRRNFIKGWR